MSDEQDEKSFRPGSASRGLTTGNYMSLSSSRHVTSSTFAPLSPELPVDIGLNSGEHKALVSSDSSASTAALPTLLRVELHGKDMTLAVTTSDKPLVRQHFKELVRKEKRRAANAGNAANTSQQIGVGIGGALAVGGGVAMVTVAAPLFVGAAIVTGVGGTIAVLGLGIAHWMNAKKFSHEERVDRFQDTVEELK